MKYLYVLILDIAVSPDLSVEVVMRLRQKCAIILHHTYLSNALIHVDPLTASGEEHHYVSGHYGDRTPHSHK